MVPIVVPLTNTDAPITLSPAASFTTPEHVDFCCTMLGLAITDGCSAYSSCVVPPTVSSNAPSNFSLLIVLKIKVYRIY